jgi:hypothetical protein
VLNVLMQTGSLNVDDDDNDHLPFVKQPFSVFRGHTADLLDVSWSKVGCNTSSGYA